MLKSDSNLVTELNNNGLLCTSTSKLFSQIKNELHEFARKHPLLDYGKLNLTNENDEESDETSSHSSGESSDSSDDEEAIDESILDMNNLGIFNEDGRLINTPPPNNNISTEDWNVLINKYAKFPTNTLEKDREEYFKDRHRGKTIDLLDCRSEADLLIFQRQRYILLLIYLYFYIFNNL